MKALTQPLFGLFSLLALVWSSAVAQGSGAKLEAAGGDTIDFGKYASREVKTADFKIRNSGRDTVKILKIHITCGCASATCDKSELNPGETAGVKITTLANSINGTYARQVYVENTAESNRFLSLTIKGTAIPLVEIKPQDFVYAGRIDTNSQWSQSFEIAPTEPGVKLGEPDVKFNYPVETRLTASGGKEDSRYRLDVRLLPSAKPGSFHGTINLPVINPSNHPPLAIGILGTIGPELIAIPGTFRIPVSSNEVVRTFRLKLLGDASAILDPRQIVLPDENGVACQVKKADEGRTIAVIARFSPQFINRLHVDGKAEIRFSLPDILPARVVCLPEK